MEESSAELTNVRNRTPILPMILSASIIVADQLSKAWIVKNIDADTIGKRLFGDFLWIVHTRNLGIAFSLGDSISNLLRIAFFIILPAFFILAAIVYCWKSDKLTNIQRYAIAFIVGGGAGNLIDRIFRPEGVVDFISFSMFRLFGLDRFPTFNVADLTVTIGASLLLISGFLWDVKEKPSVEKG
jgi:signal peptidase II